MRKRSTAGTFFLIAFLIGAMGLVGCTPQPKEMETTTTTVVASPEYWRMNPSVARTDEEALAILANDIQTARDSASEGDAIQRLHQWEADHNLTYQVQAVRLDAEAVIASPSTYPYPVRVDVSVFRQTRPVYHFSFVPRNNRNLALMGE
jgi:hypothetical protein